MNPPNLLPLSRLTPRIDETRGIGDTLTAQPAPPPVPSAPSKSSPSHHLNQTTTKPTCYSKPTTAAQPSATGVVTVRLTTIRFIAGTVDAVGDLELECLSAGVAEHDGGEQVRGPTPGSVSSLRPPSAKGRPASVGRLSRTFTTIAATVTGRVTTATDMLEL
jgi:hypothetical protein